MAVPEKDLDRLREEQEKDDADLLADLDKEAKEFDKVPWAHNIYSSRVLTITLGRRDRSHNQSLPRQRLRCP